MISPTKRHQDQDARDADQAERRIVDHDWKVSVDDLLKEGQKRFAGLEQGQAALLGELKNNSEATRVNGGKLDLHMASYNEFLVKVQPAIDAVDTMQSGVRVIGKIGNAAGWIGRNLRRLVVWVTPFIALGTALYGYVDGWFKRGG